MSSLSFSPSDEGRRGVVAAHEGVKPVKGDYLALGEPDKRRLYRVVKHNHCWNVDPPNMWIAHVEFIPGRDVPSLKDLPADFYEPGR